MSKKSKRNQGILINNRPAVIILVLAVILLALIKTAIDFNNEPPPPFGNNNHPFGTSQMNPGFSSQEIEDYVKTLPKTSNSGNVEWSGDYFYTYDDPASGFAMYQFNTDGTFAFIAEVGIPANLPIEEEKVFWKKEVIGTLFAIDWLGANSINLPGVVYQEQISLVDGLSVLYLTPNEQRLLGASYNSMPYFAGKYIQWDGIGLTCEQIYAIDLMATGFGQVQGYGTKSLLIQFDCPFN